MTSSSSSNDSPFLDDEGKDSCTRRLLHPPIHRRGKLVLLVGEYVCERGRAPVDMDEEDQATQDAQRASDHDQAATNCDIGFTSRGHTQEFTQASGMTY
ncbi:hypothetical protein FXO38_17061 [Capsicum annuum]|nr:hypothetical protein FXO38_17061 [Capsicum annuum]